MAGIGAEEISGKLKALLDELSALKVHAVILASFAKSDRSAVFGMEMNTSQAVAQSLLQAGGKRLEAMRPVEASAGV